MPVFENADSGVRMDPVSSFCEKPSQRHFPPFINSSAICSAFSMPACSQSSNSVLESSSSLVYPRILQAVSLTSIIGPVSLTRDTGDEHQVSRVVE